MYFMSDTQTCSPCKLDITGQLEDGNDIWDPTARHSDNRTVYDQDIQYLQLQSHDIL